MVKELSNNNVDAPVLPSERGKEIARQINRAVRILRVKSPTKRVMYQSAGLKPRLHDRLFSALFSLILIFVLIGPSLLGIVYYGFYISKKYESETRFVIRPATSATNSEPSRGQNALPADKLIQDTQVVLSYIQSPAILSDLQSKVDLKDIFGRKEIDYFSRLEADETREGLLEYWSDMVEQSTQRKSGIITLTAKAYTPEDAQKLGTLIVEFAEQKVNSLNAGIWKTLRKSTTTELANAQKAMAENRLALEKLQNETGIFDRDIQAELITEVILELQTSLIDLRARQAVLSRNLAFEAAERANVRFEIATREEQLETYKSQLAGVAKGQSNLSGFSKKLDIILVNKEIAEKRLRDAVRDFERIKITSELQLTYLDRFQEPTLPQASLYLERIQKALAVIGLSFLAWIFSFSILRYLRNKID